MPAACPGLGARRLSLLVLVCASPVWAQSPAAPGAAPIPEHVLAEMARMVGRWEADNSAYVSESEPFERYALEWTWGLGRKSLVGRLFAVHAGEDTEAFWHYLHYWHPGEAKVVAFQIGRDGTVGVGAHEPLAGGRSALLQTFYDPSNGSTYRAGHRTRLLSDDEHLSESFSVDAQGVWSPRRAYTWKKVR